jgi:hypothetical protein
VLPGEQILDVPRIEQSHGDPLELGSFNAAMRWPTVGETRPNRFWIRLSTISTWPSTRPCRIAGPITLFTHPRHQRNYVIARVGAGRQLLAIQIADIHLDQIAN